tara:strand:+ start:2403 stop:2576 length:174 start_codon:yes stop_codon:yes gene_type:complete
MKVGDLVRDLEWGEIGLVISITYSRRRPYNVLCPDGVMRWLSKKYIEKECEVVDESR